jgi:hypothetical protein
MWSKFVARAELLRMAATMVEQDDRVEEAEALSRLVFDTRFVDENEFRCQVGSILRTQGCQMDRIVTRIRMKGAQKRKAKNDSVGTETKG